MELAWQNDWKMFVDVLADQLQRRVENLEAVFAAKSVRWSGVLAEKLLSEPAPMVTVVMPKAQINLGDRGVVNLSDKSLPVAQDAIGDWERIPIGTTLSFTAILGAEGSPFPAVQVKHLNSGRTIILIRLSNARPCPNGN